MAKKKKTPKQKPEAVPEEVRRPGIVERLAPYERWIEISALILVLAVGFVVRIEDVRDWKSHPDLALYQGEPLLTTFDGYYYLTLARDLVEGTYAPLDEKRAVPDYPRRPSPPPLLSVIAAGVAKITPFSMNWIGAVLPTVLGLLLAVPLYLMGRFYGGPVMGLTSALMGLLSYYYVYRSSLGWFDTDCMNVTWAMGAAYCFLRFGVEAGTRRYLYMLGGFLVTALFLWWWDQTRLVALVVSLLPFAVALVFFYRPQKREALIFVGVFAVMAGAALLWKGTNIPLQVIHEVGSKFSYISKETAGDFPNLGVTISEQARPDFQEVVAKTTNNMLAFVLAGIGLLWLFVRKPKESLFLSVPFLLAVFSFLFAKRFLIFLAPITALGMGYLVAHVWHLHKRFRLMALAAPVLVVIMAGPALTKGMAKTFWPKEPPHLIAGMDLASSKTPKDAVIWAWWDHGYPLIYWSRRATVNDGSVHAGERSVYNGIPLATSSYRLSANFMKFYVERGLSGMQKFYRAAGGEREHGLALIKRVLGAGPEEGRNILAGMDLKPTEEWKTVDDWLRFFFPPDPRPVYIYLDWRLTVTSYWWFWLGSWDIAKHDGIHPFYNAYYNVRLKGSQATNNANLFVDLKKGEAGSHNRTIPLRSAVIHDGRHLQKHNFKNPDGVIFELLVPTGFAALEDRFISDSVFNKLFLLHTGPQEYFRPLSLNTPSYQLWEVRGDRL